MDGSIVASFTELLTPFLGIFSAPTQQSFLTLAKAWVMACGPRTVTNLIEAAGPEATKSHDAYQYFFSQAKWEIDSVWKVLFEMVLSSFGSSGVIRLAGDDTLLHHGGKNIFGVGLFRDAVRSKGDRTVFAMGHNWVVLFMIVKAPLLNESPIALPILARLRPKEQRPKDSKRKGKSKKDTSVDSTVVDLMKEMLQTVTSWAPGRQFEVLLDAAYGSLAGSLPANTHMICRIRSDAALHDFAPARTGRVGRPKSKGEKLPSPAELANLPTLPWQSVQITLYGKDSAREVHFFDALWYRVCPQRPIRIVCARLPNAKGKATAFFFSTDISKTPEQILEGYAGRWPVESAYRESKQSLGIEGPQAQAPLAVKRQAPFGFLLLSLIKLWYLTRGYKLDSSLDQTQPWYPHKQGVSFDEMLCFLRRSFWRESIFLTSPLDTKLHEILEPLILHASRAA